MRTGLFHLAFNVATVLLGLLLVDQVTAWAATSAGDMPRPVADTHLAFNVAGVRLVLPFTATIARLLARLVPEGERERAERGRAVAAT